MIVFPLPRPPSPTGRGVQPDATQDSRYMSTPDKPPSRQMAVALAYRNGDAAPKVVASGRGLIAQAIIERARENGVFVHESEELVSMLMQVELDQHIPPQLYLAVAELLAWLYRLERGRIHLNSRYCADSKPATIVKGETTLTIAPCAPKRYR